MIKLTQEAGSVALTNDTHPDFQRLPEADRADMDAFIEHARLVLPILGCDLFRLRSSIASMSVPGSTDPGSGDSPTFVFSTAGARATARETDDGFVVLAGSTARRRASDTFPAGYHGLRKKLIADHQLVDGPSDELLSFAVDVVFTSPSAVPAVVRERADPLLSKR